MMTKRSGSVLRGRDARDAFTGEWDELARTNPCAYVFQSSGWYSAWIEAVAEYQQAEPLVLRVPSVGRMRAALALQISRDSPAVLRPLTWPWADYHEAIGSPFDDVAIEVLAGVLRMFMFEERCRLVLDDVVPGGILERIAARLQAVQAMSSLTAAIDLTDTSHVALILGQREHMIKARRLGRLGVVECRHLCDERMVMKAMPYFIELHSQRWAGRSDAVAPFGEGVVDAAFAAMIRHLAPRGSLLFTEMTLGGRPVAMYFGFTSGNRYGAYRTAFDEEFKRFSPGHLMLRQMVTDFASAGYHELDLMRGAYAYKDAYVNRRRYNLRLDAQVL
jgi:CelD/BcsL family acetyltransferase involved in cellulose biosynthesis